MLHGPNMRASGCFTGRRQQKFGLARRASAAGLGGDEELMLDMGRQPPSFLGCSGIIAMFGGCGGDGGHFSYGHALEGAGEPFPAVGSLMGRTVVPFAMDWAGDLAPWAPMVGIHGATCRCITRVVSITFSASEAGRGADPIAAVSVVGAAISGARS